MFWFYSLLALIPVMFIWSGYLLRKQNWFRLYLLVNTAFFALYFLGIFFTPLEFFEQDPYGLKKIFLFLYILLVHALGCFTFALYHHYKSKNGSRQRSSQ